MFDRYSIGEIINVHGLLNDNPILGVNDVTQIGNEQYRSDYELVQMLVKSEIDKKISKGWREQACNIINKTDAIYVFGMSLGDTDLFWWQSIAKWLEEDEAHLLKVHCHKESDTQRMIEKKEQIYNKFASHCQKMDILLTL